MEKWQLEFSFLLSLHISLFNYFILIQAISGSWDLPKQTASILGKASYTKQRTECRPACVARTPSLNTYAPQCKGHPSIYSPRPEVMVFQTLLAQYVNSSS